MTEWQPIETAPVDNRYILIWSGGWRHPFAGRNIGDGWVLIDNADTDASQTRMHASHWRSLPPPPAGGDA